jgi:hypothetical protein
LIGPDVADLSAKKINPKNFRKITIKSVVFGRLDAGGWREMASGHWI